MRKNLIPLLAIALVVAVLSTAVFYGLIADRLAPSKSASANTGPAPTAMLVAARNIERGKLLESADVRLSDLNCPSGQNCVKDVAEALGRATLDPLVEGQTISEQSLSRPAGAAPSSVIPVGMRAVTMHVADSLGVVQMVRSGDRVDIQIIAARDAANPGLLEVRTVMPAVEVLNVGPPEPGSPLAGRPVVTVLLSPADADRVSLADTVGRLRIVLRNRQDQASAKGEAVAAKPVSASLAAPEPAVVQAAGQGPDIFFDVQWISPKRADTLDVLGGHFAPDGQALQVVPVVGEKSWPALEAEGRLAIVAKSQLVTRESGEVSLERAGHPGLNIRLTPRLRGDGRLSVRIEPTVKASLGDPATERRLRSDLAFSPGESFLVAGLEGPDGIVAVITPRVVARAKK
ncbi:MAG: Flp pilus assembly protein CpaB [Bryobacteraceae bacterium]|nr:Flp pilus assembly protein CpaB [Bryobacteraceae bacterium]